MADKLIPANFTDGQLVSIPGPDNSTIGYQYDKQQRAFYGRESTLLFSGKHGTNHITTDPIPSATCTTPGLMSADDKCRLDAITGTRVGVIGFAGAGFPDDGGFLSGDIILAAGNEMISIERVGNIVRFVVDIPATYSCGNEDCVQIFWVQDETDVNAIRPPINGGKISGVNSYGELKIYLFPEATIVNPADPSKVFNKKAFYPSMIFKRYDDGTGVNEGELDVTLKRNNSGTATVGWAFTPGATGKPECQWFLGVDQNNSRIAFKLDPNTTPGVLGAVLYNGHSITKKAAVITGYDPTVIQTNVYKAKWWDIQNKKTIGSEFNITNLFQWNLSDNAIVLDSTLDSLLPIGQIIDTWSFKVGESNGASVYTYYCREQPPINTSNLWTTLGAVEFGNTVDKGGSETRSDVRTIENAQWGVDGLEPVVYNQSTTYTTINGAYDAEIDDSIPALVVNELPLDGTESVRPITIWNRASIRDAFIEIHVSRPTLPASERVYPPIDVLLRAPIDGAPTGVLYSGTNAVISGGTYDGLRAVSFNTSIPFKDLPSSGTVRNLSSTAEYAYSAKVFDVANQTIKLLFQVASYPTSGTLCELVREHYKCPALRLQFAHNVNTHDIEMQPIFGILDPGIDYESGGQNGKAGDFQDGYVVGLKHWQNGSTISGTNGITVYPEGFVVYTGTGDASGDEVFNVIKILVVDNKVWVWWNDLLLSPSAGDSINLPEPVDVSDPFYSITDVMKYGKFGVRLWPGAQLRRFVLRSRPTKFSEYTLGQVEVG